MFKLAEAGMINSARGGLTKIMAAASKKSMLMAKRAAPCLALQLCINSSDARLSWLSNVRNMCITFKRRRGENGRN